MILCRENKKLGLSSLIGEVIMISLVIAIAAFVYLWGNSFSQGNISKTDEKVYELKECAQILGRLDEFFYDLQSDSAKMLISVAPAGKSYIIEKIELYNVEGEKCTYDNTLILRNGEAKFITFQCEPGFLNNCKDLKNLAIVSPCSDKSIYLTDPLVSSTDNKCKLKSLLFY
ncbi:MAG: hypothetical protein GXN99_03410 [Candidatus Nanohaloarchaeota archaeon]|nr:hypothetical protein [Candidatus Nanohaloarchaeota archaeon]